MCENNFSGISDDELDNSVRVVLTNSPNSGKRMVSGALAAQGIRVQRSRLHASINLNCEDTHRLVEEYTIFQHPIHCGKYFEFLIK